MWIWWTKINQNPNILGLLSVIKWRNWTWWESYLNTGISDETQIAVVVWLQWLICSLFLLHNFNEATFILPKIAFIKNV